MQSIFIAQANAHRRTNEQNNCKQSYLYMTTFEEGGFLSLTKYVYLHECYRKTTFLFSEILHCYFLFTTPQKTMEFSGKISE
jgi:hypothetical protein